MIEPFSPEWFEARAATLGASEVAALYDVHPFLSRFALWQAKAGRIAPPVVDNERAKWGLRLEAVIAEAAAEERGWKIERGTWLRDGEEPRLSATPDFLIVPDGVLEIKNVDAAQFARAWGDEPPLHVLLQVQAQLAVTGREEGYVAALVGGNTLRIFRVPRRPAIIDDMRRRVAEFWASIERGEEPPPDGSASASEALRALHRELSDDAIDLTGDNRAPELCAALLAAIERRKAAEAEENALRAELMAKLSGHRAAIVPGFRVRVVVTPEKPETVITPEMVGQTMPGRKEVRRLVVKEET